MKKIALLVLVLLSGCAGPYHGSRHGGFRPSLCARIPVGVERFQYIDPSLKEQKISCALLARCAALYGLSAPPNVPCE